MDYVIKFIDSTACQITLEEHKAILQSKDNLVLLPRLQRTIAKNSISGILKISDYEEDRLNIKSTQKEGVLHDGLKVVKHFGRWARADSGYYDNNGNLQYDSMNFDYEYYPEIALDEVKTPNEYINWRQTNTSYLNENASNKIKRLKSEPQSIGSLLSNNSINIQKHESL